MEILMKGIAWVCLAFSDGTQAVIHTTLNPNVLKNYGVGLKENYFFDIDHLRFIKFREDAIDITVSEERPNPESEVLIFASRFI